MNRKIILPIILMLSLTACGGGNTEETSPAESPETSAAETVSQTESETSSETVTETETADTEPAEEAADDNADNGISGDTDKYYGGIFHGSGYTLKVDGGVWTDMSVMIDYVKEKANDVDLDIGIDLTAEQFDDVYDCMFICPGSSGANFNVTVMDMGVDIDINEAAELYGTIIEQQYSAIDGVDFFGSEITSAGGYDCLKTELEMTSGDTELRMAQFCFWENQAQVVLTFTAQSDEFGSMFTEFEKVLNSVSFEENSDTQTV
ncbi:MAG: hypothetical protein NC078_00270 [Ruminococcus sp.]|nr:hypothetical protein [Ruminococcus sp.]